MKTKYYWDSSALIATINDEDLGGQLAVEGGVTRPHTLTEIFSTLTGGKLGWRVDANDAAKIVAALARKLQFIDLTADEILKALTQARAKGVRGGRVHDYLHAVTAKKAEATILLTTDQFDFSGLFHPVRLV